MTVGERIKAARKQAGLTQKELAERLGLSFQAIAQWENNLRKPKLETLQKIAAALEVPIYELMEMTEEQAKLLEVSYNMERVKDNLAHTDISKFHPDLQKRIPSTLVELEGRVQAYRQVVLDLYKGEDKQEIALYFSKLNDEGISRLWDYLKYLSTVPEYQLETSEEASSEDKNIAHDS